MRARIDGESGRLCRSNLLMRIIKQASVADYSSWLQSNQMQTWSTHTGVSRPEWPRPSWFGCSAGRLADGGKESARRRRERDQRWLIYCCRIRLSKRL